MKKEEPNNSLWAYTKDRKWIPLHNADAFDGYDEAGINFESIKYNNGNVTISKLINTKISPEILKINKIAENQTYKVEYYFWKGDNNVFYLMRENNATSQSVWNYTRDRKWQPIYNADAFDGYSKAGKTLESVLLDKNTSILTIGKADKAAMEYSIKLKSSDLDKDNHYSSEFFKSSPNMSWSISNNLENKTKNFIIVMRNTKTNDLVWVHTAKGNENNISRGIKGEKTVIPNGSFCSRIYNHKATKEKTINVSIAIYVIDNISILEDLQCAKRAETENIVSSKIDATLDVSILSGLIGKFSEHSNNDGSIKDKLILEFKNNTFVKKQDPSFVEIANLPDGLTSSYAIEEKEIYITLKGNAKKDEGIADIIITLKSELWEEKVSNQTIRTSISFLDNTRNINDIQNEPYYKYSWHQKPLKRLGPVQNISDQSHMNIEKAWEITRGKGVVVAILDTDFEVYHSDLTANVQSSFNSKTGGADVSPSFGAESSHGTSVAGVIGAPVNGIGIVGAAPESKMIFVKFPFNGPISSIIKAFDYAQAQGAKVINCSWGGIFVGDVFISKMKELYDAGIIVVFASGNSNVNTDYENIGVESRLETVLGVGASDEFNVRAWYSNYGSTLDFVAPGGKFGVLTTDESGHRGSNNTQNLVSNDYSFKTGTSFSAPNASGVIALMVSVNPKITPKEVRDIIIKTADKIVGGYDANGFNLELGYGKINAYKAVSMAKAMRK